VAVRVGQVGKTSIEMLYTVAYDGEVVADAVATMVCVAGATGSFKPSAVPERVRRAASTIVAEPRSAAVLDSYGGAEAVTMDQAYTRRVLASVTGVPRPSAETFVHEMVVRFSDEDVNKHTNHAGYARFCSDAVDVLRGSDHPLVSALGGAAFPWFLRSLVLEYVAETKAQDTLTIYLTAGANSPGEVAVAIARGDTLCTKGVLELTTSPDARL
jgi:acyl-CoA thioesterase FadM